MATETFLLLVNRYSMSKLEITSKHMLFGIRNCFFTFIFSPTLLQRINSVRNKVRAYFGNYVGHVNYDPREKKPVVRRQFLQQQMKLFHLLFDVLIC